MPKKRASRTALRRRARAERSDAPGDNYSREILRELERAGEPLTPKELAARLELRGRERSAFSAGLAALERAGEVVQNRAGSLLVAKRIAVLAGRVEGHPDGHGFLVPDEGGASVFLPPHEMRSLMHGDRASVRVSGTDHRGRPLGALDEVRDEDARGRRDLRALEFVTIDGETARDFDDAVVCRREGKDFRLWVAIADVSHYVKHGDALDMDARERGTSVYFPRRVIPMLPEKLSNGICSLNPNVERLAVVCEVEISAQGELGRYEFYPAVFRSHARLTYTQVWADIQSGQPPTHIARLYDLFKVLYASRSRRGAIDFETVET